MTFDWSDVVLAEDVRRALEELRAFALRRKTIFDEWGFGAKFPSGREDGPAPAPKKDGPAPAPTKDDPGPKKKPTEDDDPRRVDLPGEQKKPPDEKDALFRDYAELKDREKKDEKKPGDNDPRKFVVSCGNGYHAPEFKVEGEVFSKAWGVAKFVIRMTPLESAWEVVTGYNLDGDHVGRWQGVKDLTFDIAIELVTAGTGKALKAGAKKLQTVLKARKGTKVTILAERALNKLVGKDAKVTVKSQKVKPPRPKTKGPKPKTLEPPKPKTLEPRKPKTHTRTKPGPEHVRKGPQPGTAPGPKTKQPPTTPKPGEHGPTSPSVENSSTTNKGKRGNGGRRKHTPTGRSRSKSPTNEKPTPGKSLERVGPKRDSDPLVERIAAIRKRLSGDNRVGKKHEVPGGLLGAIRNEVRTGARTKGKFHSQKGRELLRYLKKQRRQIEASHSIRQNPTRKKVLDSIERLIVKLQDALSGK